MSTRRPATPVRAARFDGRTLADRPDHVACEEPLEVRLALGGGEPFPFTVTMRTPGSDFELALGLLVSEGVVQSVADVDTVSYCREGAQVAHAVRSDGKRWEAERYNTVTVRLRPGIALDLAPLHRTLVTTSACGVCGKASIEGVQARASHVSSPGPRLSADVVAALPERLGHDQRLFHRTGGLHAAGLFTPAGDTILVREDVGRHNAVDKVVGALLMAGELPASDGILLVSGRASFEIVQKAAMAGVPVVAAVGAPSSLAVETAAELGMTLCGFVRGGTFNLYTGGDRIVVRGGQP